ncbi:MAG: hypothetical protein N2V72_07165 [Methanophagales archaeon]|nr:hypothetical protein [Methanophagales archaeon]
MEKLKEAYIGGFIESVEDLKGFIKEKASELFKKSSYATGWVKKFSPFFLKIFKPCFCNLLSE